MKFSYERRVLSGIDFRAINYVPVLAFGNENDKIYQEESGFAHLYVKALDDVKIIFF